jgi:hypothetical protein
MGWRQRRLRAIQRQVFGGRERWLGAIEEGCGLKDSAGGASGELTMGLQDRYGKCCHSKHKQSGSNRSVHRDPPEFLSFFDPRVRSESKEGAKKRRRSGGFA